MPFCSWCGEKFRNKRKYKAHLIKHDGEAIDEHFQCIDCDGSFYNKKAYAHHLVTHHEDVVFNETLSITPSNKIYIDANGTRQPLFYCPLCGQEYKVKSAVKKHIKLNHKLEILTVSDDLIKCDLCEAHFFNEEAINFHESFHTKNDKYAGV